MNKKILISDDSSLETALKKMNALGKKCLIIANEGKFINCWMTISVSQPVPLSKSA